jgi:nicotinate-nucleotide pyrophosphorylase (carboxylating)
MGFRPPEAASCRQLVELALEEDLNAAGDITSAALIPEQAHGRAVLRARSAGVLSGWPAAEMVYATLDPLVKVEMEVIDADRVNANESIGVITGSVRALLAGERTALNFLQRLSGIATLTRRYVDLVAGTRCQVLDTRKTTPGWRLLEKYAVRCGGGHNHRLGLYDAALIKDNHIAAIGTGARGVSEAIRRARAVLGPAFPLIVELDHLSELDAALVQRPHVVLLDNMTLDMIVDAVRRRDALAPGVLLEVSGGVDLTTVRGLAEAGADRISVGGLTHSAPALDIGLDYEST